MKQIAMVETARLTALAEYLYTVPSQNFNLRSWVTRIPRKATTTLFGLIEISPGCGFAGCAMGWAAYSQIFPDFTVQSDGHLTYLKNGLKCMDWDAAKAVLGLNSNMAYHLLSAKAYKITATPAMVADRLTRLVTKIEAIRARNRRRNAPSAPKLELVA